MKRSSARLLVGLIIIGLFFQMGTLGAAAQESSIVRSIEVQGNTFIDTETIKASILKTKVNQPAVEQQILDDLRSIYDLGYFQDATASFEPATAGVQVVFHVVENPVVREIDFSGMASIPFADYRKQMSTQTGFILNIHDLWEDLYGLREWIATEHGYFARIADLTADTDGLISVVLAQTTLKDIVIEGNEKTRDFVIERELSFEPGDPVNIHQVDQSLRRVLMLGYFDGISRDFSEEDDPDETVLTINLDERKTGSATFGVSYSSTDRLLGFVEAADDNFLGRGQRVNATARFGKRLQEYELGFYEPYIDKTGTSLGLNLYRRSRPLNVTGVEPQEPLEARGTTNGGDLTLGRPFGEFSRGRLTLKLENTTYDLPTEPIQQTFKDYRNRTIGFGVNTNTADHPFNPTEGYKNDVYLEVGTRLLGGDMQYAKLRLEHSRYFEIRDGGWVLALRGLGGRLLGGDLGDGGQEAFSIGGADTLRGYPYGGYTDEGEQRGSLVGDHMLVMNAELRIPVLEKVTGVLFTDWGTTWDKNAGMGFTDLENSFGLGVRLDTPLGLLRLDYGWGKDAEEERKGQFYFGIGQMF
ncbi:MAG TPA: BamA/TamA family outer membrane protein [Limnochordia bacterium]|nr:BamA/TamA family outer membrane protein [Limnochordia bacterium]